MNVGHFFFSMQQIERILLFPVVLAYVNLPLLGLPEFQLPCLFKILFGFECPGCGMTRALAAIFHGDFLRAIELNFIAFPAAIVLSCLFAFEVLHLARTMARGKLG
jgi:hypothetical protein